MSVSTIIPAVVDRLVDRGLEDPCVLLPGSKDRYLHSVLGYGREVDLPGGDLDPSEFPVPVLDIALPGERWCDVTHRRDRYNELVALVDGGGVDNINDAVTANLDLAGVMEDYLSQMTPDECEVAFEVLRSLTVCDPTCGSGAFLLSALDVLEPMYTLVLDRAREIADSVARGPAGWSHVPQFLEEAENHPSDRYWLLKTICLNNLYGVDLMGEAAEIAKLRLFLKLVAQLEDVSQIEPLPDLDFNIKSGNLLVGIADLADADRRFSDDLLQLLGIKAAEQAAKKAADAYELFVKEQIADSGTSAVAGKQRLTAQIHAATTQADVALYEMRDQREGLEAWAQSHAPFHWFAEFPSVWRDGGFDVVIGNPPYINKKDVTEYSWRGYITEKCPDLYAVCVERASTLVNPSGRLAMIVMHSLCFGKLYAPLRNHLTDTFPALWVSSYANIPGCLFAGSAKVRNSILIASRTGGQGLLTTQVRRWLADGRPTLFFLTEYTRPHDGLLTYGLISQWPFINSAPLSRAFTSMIQEFSSLKENSLVKESDHKLAVTDNARYKFGIYDQPPPDIHPNGIRKISPKYNWLCFRTSEERDIAWLIMGGRWGYLWWLAYDDEYHVKKSVLGSFPADLPSLVSSSQGSRLLQLAGQLRRDLPKFLSYKLNAGIQVARYDILKCSYITDEADLLLARAWGIEYAYEPAGGFRDRMTFGSR
ncbi:MAG: Eco57I restriction-modification methylase domain-containing protein [bacterium]|nr:Eco57I restriction-modification methylase domain-containing protein [bacterium]